LDEDQTVQVVGSTRQDSHRMVFLGLLCYTTLILVVGSEGGRSTATVCHAGLWARMVKTAYGLPLLSGTLEPKSGFSEKLAMPLSEKHVAGECEGIPPSLRHIPRAF